MTDKSLLNPVKNRFLPLPRSAVEGLEHEPTIEDFDFTKQLGVGSFGEVHLAVHKKTKAQYAIKIIDKSLRENIEEKANFNREVEIMYKLNHPNIVKLYGHFEDNDFCYFIMQYIPKRSVFDIITIPGTQPNLKLIASVMKDLISAVYYLHHMKPTIIHRDIKPENILLDENSKAYLTDFGWSNYMKAEKKRHTICGSPLYLPPEMVGNFGHDETADIWCIGVLLFELIVGNAPFAGLDLQTVKNNIKKLNICWPPKMDPDAKDLTAKILKLNGKDRLPIEDILNHNFFRKFFPNAINELIKPESQKYRTFIVSKDNPKTWVLEQKPPTSDTSSIKNNNSAPKYKKIEITNTNKDAGKAKEKYIPRANIDLSKGREKNYRKVNDNINNKPLNNSYNVTIKRNTNNSSTNNKSNYKRISNNNSLTNSNKNSYKANTSTTTSSYTSNFNYRNSYKPSNFHIPNKTSNENYRNSYRAQKINPLKNYNSNTTDNNNNNRRKYEYNNNKAINSSFNANTNTNQRIMKLDNRRSYRPSTQNNSYYSSYNSKK